MKLSEIADVVGVPVCQITPGAIAQANEKGLITGGQKQKLLSELRKADRIWENSIPGIACAPSLW